MFIVVLVNQILDPAGVTVRRDKEQIFVNKEEYVIAPGDKNALEAALQLKDAAPDSRITAIAMGPPRVDDALREALAMGADAAILVSDSLMDAILSAGVDLHDEPLAARILAGAVRRLEADLVISGSNSQIGPRVAELLDLAQITAARTITVSQGSVQATRVWDGAFAAVSAPLPVLVTVEEGANQPRYPHGARIMNAYREWQVPVWDAAELGFDGAELASVMAFRGQSFAAPFETGELIRGDPEEAARELLAILRSHKLVTIQKTFSSS